MGKNEIWESSPNESRLKKILRLLTFDWKFRKAMIGENNRDMDHFYSNMQLVEKKPDGSVVVKNKAGVRYTISGNGLKRRMTIDEEFIK